jgi:multidrug efflux pump subunit AcrA (membrane-fusion protein)
MVNAKSRLTQANIHVGDTRVKAPFSGIINKKYIEVGAILSAMPPTQMFELVNTSSLKLKVSVSESQVAQLKVGSIVKVKATVYPDKEYVGKVTFVAPKADESLNFPIEVAVTKTTEPYIPALISLLILFVTATSIGKFNEVSAFGATKVTFPTYSLSG